MKVRIVAVSTLGVILCALAYESPQGSVKAVSIPDLLSQVSESEILHTATDLQNFGTRQVGTQGNIDAATYIRDRLAAIPGLSVAYQGGSQRNVVATLAGTDSTTTKVCIVGAHYDSWSSTAGAAPGATDDACGVGIVLELARIMSQYRFKETLKFAAWNGEELGELGSTAYAKEAVLNQEDIHLYFNYDSSCYDPDGSLFLDIVYNNLSSGVANRLTELNSLYRIGFLGFLDNYHVSCGSDHRPFWDRGYCAVFTHSETHGPSHTANDTADKISTPYAKKNGQLGLAILAELAGLEGTPPSAAIHLSRSSLNFGAAQASSPTSSQTLIVSNSGQGTLNWTATPSQGWLQVSPGAGTGTGIATVSVNVSGLPPGTYTGSVYVADPNASNSPQSITVTLRIYHAGAISSPFGYFETPAEGTSGMEGSIPVTGWALDDIEVTKVDIWRDPVEGEPTYPNGYVYIGEAVFVEGARPDVETAYPAYPLNYRAGWGYMMLTNFLPNQGNGAFRIHAIAHDKDGHATTIGTKTMTCDNAHATLPFGAIDTPAQGGTWNGTQVNFGWALTPQPKSIPTNGSTILLWIDGQPIGHPTYNNYRSDIATLFPGLANSNGAVGYYYVNTTQYTNGVHTIVWSVDDSAGKASGIGSRYFTVVNTGAGSASGLGEASTLRRKSQDNRHAAASIAGQGNSPADNLSPVYVREGYDLDALAEPVFPDANGVINIKTQEVGRIEVALSEDAAGQSLKERTLDDKEPARAGADKEAKTPVSDRGRSASMDEQRYVGYLVVGDQLRPLPTGSTFDSGHGVFSWQLGPGFIGDYNFVFISQEGAGGKHRTNVRVRILPAFQQKR
jgi:Peptidase family M28/Viral BACON domain